MEDHRLKSFCLVYEMKSFSKAAAAKFMTQSAMSHLIRNLEEEIGVKLLNRQGKTVLPTASGRLFYAHAKKVLDQYRSMEDAVFSSLNAIKGTLSIGATTTVSTYLLPELFYSFSKTYPEVSIELAVSNTDAIIKGMMEGTIELGIVEGNLRNPSVHADEIAQDEIVVIAADDNPISRKKSISVRELLAQPLIMPEQGSGTREIIDDFLREIGTGREGLNIVMTLGSPELIIQMVKSGIGVAFVSKWSAFQPIKDGSVKLLDIPGKKLPNKFHLICSEKNPSTLAANTFMKFVKKYRFFEPF